MRRKRRGVCRKGIFLGAILLCGCLLSACAEGEAPQSAEASYGSVCYFEDLSGRYVRDSLYTTEKSGAVGTEVSLIPEEVEGFVFDADNPKNKLTGTIEAGGFTTFVAYYDRMEYDVTVNGGTASKSRAKYGETITLLPLYGQDGFSWNVSGEMAVVQGNQLTVGTSDVVVSAVYNTSFILDNADYYKAADSGVTAKIGVADVSGETGLVFLYSDANTRGESQGGEQYYSFVASADGARLLRTDGGVQTELAKASLEGFSAGEHQFSVSVDGDGAISCSLDGQPVLVCTAERQRELGTEPIAFAGRAGFYSEGEEFHSVEVTERTGTMTLQEVKDYARGVMTTFRCVSYRYDAEAFDVIREERVADISAEEEWKEDGEATVRQIEGLQTVQEVVGLLAMRGNSTLVNLYRQSVADTLKQVAADMTAHLLEPYVDEDVLTVQIEGLALARDVFADDPRWWTPNAYMLNSKLVDGYEKGLLDFLQEDLNACRTIEDITAVNDRYVTDVVRAVCWHDFEFYHAAKKAELGEENVTDIWFFYNYVAPGGLNFRYVGCVDGYVWKNDYRLLGAWFNPDAADYAQTPASIIAGYVYARDEQVVLQKGE